jgi:hypothetical protein
MSSGTKSTVSTIPTKELKNAGGNTSDSSVYLQEVAAPLSLEDFKKHRLNCTLIVEAVGYQFGASECINDFNKNLTGRRIEGNSATGEESTVHFLTVP